MNRPMNSTAISATNLSVSRGSRMIVNNLSFICSAGEVHAIVGANGSGKSTLLSALAGDIKPASGEVFVEKKNLRLMSDIEQAKSRAVLPQHFPLFPYTVGQLIELAQKQRERLANPLPRASIDVTSLADRRFTTLSGGERARVMMAMTLAQGSLILLLDEPTAAFDRNHRDRFVEWLHEWKTLGYAIVLVTHEEKLEALATSVTCLD